MNDQNNEAHLIGNLIDSLGKGGDDEVFVPPTQDVTNNTTGVYDPWTTSGYHFNGSPIRHHSQWPPTYAIRSASPVVYTKPEQMSNYSVAFMQPPLSGYDVRQQQNFEVRQQQNFDGRPQQNFGGRQQQNICVYPPNSGVFSHNQWESFYTPFGPVKAVPEQHVIVRPRFQASKSENTPPSSTSSPKLPTKVGVSYRDVALKTKSDARNYPTSSAGSNGRMINAGNLSPPLSYAAVQHERKHSAPSAAYRQSSSDSLSENGCQKLAPNDNDSDSESERSAPSSVVVEKCIIDSGKTSNVRNFENMLRKNGDYRTISANAFTKHTTTATNTQAADFQKIVRRKGSKSVGSTNQCSVAGGITPTSAADIIGVQVSGLSKKGKNDGGRFGILTSAKKMVASTVDPIDPNSFVSSNVAVGGQKLNNEESKFFNTSKSPTRKSAYINNDLTADDLDDNSEDDEDDVSKDVDMADGGKSSTSTTYASLKNAKNVSKNNVAVRKTRRGDGDLTDRSKRKKKQSAFIAWLSYIFVIIAQNCQKALMWLVNLVIDICTQLADVTVYCAKMCYEKVSSSILRAWFRAGEHLRSLLISFRQKEWSFTFWWRNRKKRSTNEFGLDKNIDLPNTGEEAMKRLLMCRGQDAYSILGLKPDCTDEDVKHYYRRQAILVHPDKNSSYGADEAFKILAAAFELIGTADHRKQYDLENLHRTKAMKDLEEMFTRLREKMEEVRSTMHCDCGKKHRRFSTERCLSSARYCRKCKDHHAAREGDIWAESHWFGFLWYYYACMEGIIYDITEWAGCQKNNLKHIKPNTHLVQYRLITGRNARKSQPGDGKGLSDADAEEFLNRLLEDKLNAANGGSSSSVPRQSDFGQSYSDDGAVPPQSKFRPPTCPGDSRPRKAGRRRKNRL